VLTQCNLQFQDGKSGTAIADGIIEKSNITSHHICLYLLKDWARAQLNTISVHVARIQHSQQHLWACHLLGKSGLALLQRDGMIAFCCAESSSENVAHNARLSAGTVSPPGIVEEQQKFDIHGTKNPLFGMQSSVTVSHTGFAHQLADAVAAGNRGEGTSLNSAA
jgi:hypothetical protein